MNIPNNSPYIFYHVPFDLNTWGCNDMTWHNTCTFECGQHEPLAACCISDRNSGNCRHPRELLAVFNRYSICVPDTEADCRSCRRVCADCLQQFNYPRLHLGRQLHVLQEPFWYQRGHPATAPTPPITPMSTSPNRVPAVGCQDAYSESLWQRPPSGLACIADISDTADSQSISQALRVSHEMCRGFVHLCWLSSAGNSHSWTADLESDVSDFTDQYFRDFRLFCAELHSFRNETTECLSATGLLWLGLSGSVAESLCSERCLECQGCRCSKPFATESTWWFRGHLR